MTDNIRAYPNNACNAWIAPRGISWDAMNGGIVRVALETSDDVEFVRETLGISVIAVSDLVSVSQVF